MLQRFSRLTVLLALLASSGCVDEDTSFYITGHLSGSSSGGSCTYDPGNAAFIYGTYDPTVGNAYVLHPLYNNALQNRATFLQTDPNGVYVTAAIVEIQTLEGAPIAFGAGPNPFEVGTATFVPSATSEGTVAQTVGSVVVIPPAYGAELASSGLAGVAVVVQVTGETLGGIQIESTEFYWPIYFASLTPECGTTAQTPCNSGQDEREIIECCMSAADCDDSEECTTDTCGGVAGCSNTPVANGTSCNAGAGTCTSGLCM